MWDATVLSTVHLQERKPTEPHEYYIRTLPRQDGGENKRARFRLRESEGEEGKEGQRRDKEGPVRPNKDGLYSSEGQMGVLFMVSPYTLRGAPSGPFKAEEVCICACAHAFFFFSWLERSLGTSFSAQMSPHSCSRHERLLDLSFL